MMKIHYHDIKKRVIHDDFSKRHILINGKRGSGKSTLAIEKYKHMIDEEKIPSDKILVFFMNGQEALRWMKETDFRMARALKKYTYSSFVQRELIKYWPLVVKNCKKIKSINNFIRPQFASFDGSIYMMKLLVDHFRNKKGYLSEINSTSYRIAKDFFFNIHGAALSNISFHEIGNRIYESMETKEVLDKKVYEEMDEIIGYYIERFMKKGVLDPPLSIYMYQKYLLSDESYVEKLRNEIKYLIVDNLEECPPVQIELMNQLMPYIEKSYLFYNPEGGFSHFHGADKEYIKENLKAPLERFEIEDHFMTYKEMIYFAEALENRITNRKREEVEGKIPISLDISPHLKSEMVQNVIQKVLELIDTGEVAEDILLICPSMDPVLINDLSKVLMKKNIHLFCTSKKDGLIENPCVHALCILACLSYGYEKIILTEDDYKNFFRYIFETDYVRASLLSKALGKDKKNLNIRDNFIERIGQDLVQQYNELKYWIEGIRKNDLPLDEFFRHAYLELFLPLKDGKKYMKDVTKLIEASETFINLLYDFESIEQVEEKFIAFVQEEWMDFMTLGEKEEIWNDKNYMIMTTPTNFIYSPMHSKIQIWTDVNYEGWFPKNIKELYNPYALKRTWEKNSEMIHGTEMRTNDMVAIFKALLKKCSGKIFMYGSEYAINGHEQESIFCNTLMELLDEAGDGDGL